MGIEENKRLTKKASEEINKGNIEILYEIEDIDHILHYSFGQDVKGVEAQVQGFKELHTIFPDLQTSIVDTVAEGDMVASRFTLSGTHTGADYMGIPATGKRFEFEGAMIQRYKDGKVMERWEYLDRLDVLHQRGVIPTLDEIINLQKQKQTEEENKEVLRRFSEAIRKSDIPTIDELMTNECVFHMLGNDPPADLNRDQVIEMFSSPSYSTETVTVEDVIAEGDRVLKRTTETVKHPGKSAVIARISIYRIQDGKIAECWSMINGLGLFQQLGFIPSTEEILKNAQDNTN